MHRLDGTVRDQLGGERGDLGRVSSAARQFRRHIPRQQLGDFVDALFVDMGDDVAQIRLGIEPIEFGGTDQTIDRCGTLATGIRAGK